MESPRQEAATDELAQFLKNKLLESGEPQTVHQLVVHLSKLHRKKIKKVLLGLHTNCADDLKDFLSQHDRWFTFKGNCVGLHHIERDVGWRWRDYIREATNYYQQILSRVGCMSIERLLSYRPHATLEIQYHSGKTIEQFTKFLQSRANEFSIINDFVGLAGMNVGMIETKPIRKHTVNRVPRKVTKYLVECDFTLEKFCA